MKASACRGLLRDYELSDGNFWGTSTWGQPRHGGGLWSISASTLALSSPRLAAPQSCNETEVKIKTGGGLYNQEWRTNFTLKSTCIWTDFHTLPQPSLSSHWNFPWTEFTVKRSQKPLASLSSEFICNKCFGVFTKNVLKWLFFLHIYLTLS